MDRDTRYARAQQDPQFDEDWMYEHTGEDGCWPCDHKDHTFTVEQPCVCSCCEADAHEFDGLVRHINGNLRPFRSSTCLICDLSDRNYEGPASDETGESWGLSAVASASEVTG